MSVPASEITIVMVDDNPDDILLTRRQVRRDGIVNHIVSEKRPERLLQTLAELNRSGVDKSKIMILLDVNMPGSSGFETLKMIRQNETFKKVPVIMLSSSDNEADMFQSFEMGADGYIVKPFRADEFFAALTNIPQVRYQLVQ